MTKFEESLFDNMYLRIVHDTRKKMMQYESGTTYVMIPLTDIIREMTAFKNSLPKKKAKNKNKKKKA